ncbi:hypothetical protein KI387_006452, partial [Taxus chinensis]
IFFCALDSTGLYFGPAPLNLMNFGAGSEESRTFEGFEKHTVGLMLMRVKQSN